MRRYPLRLVSAVLIAGGLLTAACTSVSQSAVPGVGSLVRFGPFTFDLPVGKTVDSVTTVAPSVDGVKVQPAPSEQLKPAVELQSVDQTRATEQSQYLVGEMCHHMQ